MNGTTVQVLPEQVASNEGSTLSTSTTALASRSCDSVTLSVCPDTRTVRVVAEQTSSSISEEKGSLEGSEPLYVNIKPLSTLAAFDRNQKGHLTQSDLKAAVHNMRWMRKLAALLSILVVIFVVCTFGSMYVSIMLTQEIYVKGGRLTDHNGKTLSTLARLDKIVGVTSISDTDTRRLQLDTNVTDTEAPSGTLTTMQISKSYVASTIETYTNGQVNWVVPLPDGTTRTVLIQGIDENGRIEAWGRCESREGDYKWTVSCDDSPTSDQCPITSWPSKSLLTQRRLLSTRAKRKLRGASAASGRLDRALEGKQNY